MSADERGSQPVALVTGANRGIGFEVCRQLARGGMKVFLGARDPKKAESAAQELSGEGLDIVPRTVDVSEDESVGRLAAGLKEFGELDVLVNNAGINFDFRQWTSGADLGMVHETLEPTSSAPGVPAKRCYRSYALASTAGSSTSRARPALPSLPGEGW
ncbi:MAG: hypothetical protein AVDCRST_MAG78-3416 [uncultured Rubrobacteraceae bacterium]|uniref:Short-chain dehydrogenase/reductase SDR n=1 Tax=uncultured Rubrobacteraceae bacterium TaxID=349277 RepID=A0A6J4QY10_9ACTN|nr:MAG: hypothetical protein AVDCRST_MAG78-3416 [uncultured Rubrobacteraceae bacterium]